MLLVLCTHELLCLLRLQWSFGVTCWEVFSLVRSPYPGVDPFTLIKHLDEGQRLEKPSNAACSSDVYVGTELTLTLKYGRLLSTLQEGLSTVGKQRRSYVAQYYV